MGKPYKYTLEEYFSIRTSIIGRRFESDWLSVSYTGVIRIKKGYSWDGCSPKVKILGRIIGTPDGKKDEKTDKASTYYCSCVHDALYQYKGQHRITRKEADKLFLKMLKEFGFKLPKLYYLGVRIGGWIYGGW